MKVALSLLFATYALSAVAESPAGPTRPTPSEMHLIQFFLNPDIQSSLDLSGEQVAAVGKCASDSMNGYETHPLL